MHAQKSKIIRFEDFLNANGSKRIALQHTIGGKLSTLSIVSQESEGFSPRTTLIKLLGKNPVPVANEPMLGENEMAIEMPEGPGSDRRRFVKFEPMSEKELAAEKKRKN